MNKLLKLPLFLGICGAGCAAVLAGVNAATIEKITENEEIRANAGYLRMYRSYGVTIEHLSGQEDEVPAELSAVGCTMRTLVQNENVFGITYTCTVKGYAGDVSFQVAFGEGKYIGYTDLGNNETAGYGKDLISSLSKVIKGKEAGTAISQDSDYKSAIAGKSVTGRALAKSIDVCAADYMVAWEAHEKKEGGQ